jgi:zinc transport system substrate-binding protein
MKKWILELHGNRLVYSAGFSPSDQQVMKKSFCVCLSFSLFFLVLPFPIGAKGGSTPHAPTVAVTNYPLKYFAERIGGDHIEVIFPIPVDVDPAFWNPAPTGVLAFQAAAVILLNGATYSKWLDKVTLPRRKMVNTSQAFKDRYIKIRDVTTHRHGPQGKHAHAGLAFTTWIDFQQAIQQAEAIFKALVNLHPQYAQPFETNFSDLKNDLLALDRRLEHIVANNRAQPLVASHPIYDYFARRYGLNIRSVLWEPDDLPDAQQWLELETLLKQHPAKWMMWEGEPNAQSVARLQAMGVDSVVFDPTGNVPGKGDFLTVMRRNIESLKKAFP